jgi:signal transduction histidine kinase/ligand-binding sensor domain-containing protein
VAGSSLVIRVTAVKNGDALTGRCLRNIGTKLLENHLAGASVRVALLAATLCCGAQQAIAGYRFDHWTTDNGLPHNSVHGIVQTQDGYLWIATYDGLVRFDGVKFTTYDKGNSKGIASNRFQLLFEDTQGVLWSTLNPGGLTRYKDGAFTTYTPENGLPDDWIWAVREDINRDLLILTNRGIFRRSGEVFVPYTSPDGAYQPYRLVDPPYVSAALSFADAAGLHVFERGAYTTYRKDQWPVGLDIKSARQSDAGAPLWIWSKDGILYRVKDGAFTGYSIREYADKDVVSACEDDDGGLWLSIWDVGLVRLKDGLLSRYSANEGIASTQVTKIYKDREGNIWLTTETSGLYRVRKEPVAVISQQDGLGSNNVYPVYQDRKGDIWVGTQGGGLSRISNGTITALSELHGAIVTALCEDLYGYLWIAYYGGVKRFKEGRSPEMDTPRGLPVKFPVYAMTLDRAGNMWLGGGDGLTKYKDGTVMTYRTHAADINNSDARAIINIFEDSEGYLWLGTPEGLIRFRDGVMTTYAEKDGLPSNFVRAIYQDKEGALWFGTYDGGLARLKNGAFRSITTKDGLFSDGVFQILEDGRGNFWMSSNQGIYRVSKQDLDDFADGKISSVICVSYGRADGMLNPECNGGRQPAGCKDREGRLWFPTQGGVAIIDPRNVSVNSNPPPVRIEGITINHAPVAFADTLYVHPGQDDLEITYTGLSFIDSERIRFKYTVEGLDKAWTDTGTRRTAYLSRLPPGQYTFRVRAANSDGVWNEGGASIRVVVVPPFYRSWWFFVLSSLAVIGAAALAYNRRIARLRKAQHIQEAFSKQLIQYQEQERKRTAAELHDGLSQSLVVIKNRAIMAQEQIGDKEAVGDQLDEIGTSVSEAIDEVREIAHNLRPILLDRLGLTKAIESMLRRVGDANQVEFKYEIAPLDGVFPKEAEVNFYRIIQESVNNIVKHSKATQAAVCVARMDGAVSVAVHDNGKGFDPDEAARTGGFGLIGITERARILGGETAFRSSPGSGTTVEIKFKLKGDKNGG